MTALLALLLILSMSSCKDDSSNTDETAKPSDWRNTIEYEGNFYVDSETKLLYALDKGTITLWDNAGEGDKLQILEYNSAESEAIESLEIKDFNGDGANDISTIFSENESGKKYNLWLWNKTDKKYKAVNNYRGINNPVLSDDLTTVTGMLDRGIFGVVTSVYTFTQQLTLEETSVTIANADIIAQSISDTLASGAPVTLGDGTATIQSIPCTVYTSDNAYIAFTSDGTWYIDRDCVGAYRIINEKDGGFEAGFYIDEAGEIADICAQLYGCDAGELTIKETDFGNILPCSYGEDGNVIPSVDLEIDSSKGEKANGYTIERNGETLCRMLKAEKSTYYCLDPDLSGDNYYHMVAASGETKLVDFTACNYYIQ